MYGKAFNFFILFVCLAFFITSGTAFSYVLQGADKIYIVDQTGERWDVTQAKSIGFDPQRFQYGIGREAFTGECQGSCHLNRSLSSFF